MQYCSTCGSSQLVSECPPNDHLPRLCCRDCGAIHYQNPKIIVGCIALWDNRLLLSRRAIEPRRNYWNLPAGFMENNETTDAGAAREVLEETGAVVDIVRLHSVYSVLHAHQVYMVFLAKLRSLNFTKTHETLENQLFKIEDIPWSELAFTSNHFALRRYVADPDFAGVHLGDALSFKI